MKLRSIFTPIAAPILMVAAGLLLSACGQSQLAGSAQISPAAAVGSPAVKTAAVTFGTAEAGSLGRVLIGANGHTLYAFTKDVDGVSTCFDACAAAWPAVTVPAGEVPTPAGIDPALVTTVERPDGAHQLKVGKWPMYFYAGDGSPGETNGQGAGGVWFVENAAGKLIKGDTAPTEAGPATQSAAPAPKPAPAPAPAPIPAPAAEPAPAPAPAGPAVALADVGNLGEVMVGANGHTLYAFTNDPEKQSSCFDACAQAWPPVTVEEGFDISDELQSSGVSTFARPDGSRQLVMGKWALYYYAGDAAPGEANGQGSGGKWYAVDANCKLVKTAA